MRVDPVSGQRLRHTDPTTGTTRDLSRLELLTLYTDPAAYVPILQAHPGLTLCLAHFGGAGDWERYLEDPWIAEDPNVEQSWLAKILDMIRSQDYPNLFTDIAASLEVAAFGALSASRAALYARLCETSMQNLLGGSPPPMNRHEIAAVLEVVRNGREMLLTRRSVVS
jgi:hypothetical protein